MWEAGKCTSNAVTCGYFCFLHTIYYYKDPQAVSGPTLSVTELYLLTSFRSSPLTFHTLIIRQIPMSRSCDPGTIAGDTHNQAKAAQQDSCLLPWSFYSERGSRQNGIFLMARLNTHYIQQGNFGLNGWGTYFLKGNI